MSSKLRLNVKLCRNKIVGKMGEDMGAEYLKTNGFRVLERNFRTRFGEIDIVAQKGKEYFFVEVKTRTQTDFGSSLESLPFFRINRLKKMALFYIQNKKLPDSFMHLSLLGIDGASAQPQITFLPDIVE